MRSMMVPVFLRQVVLLARAVFVGALQSRMSKAGPVEPATEAKVEAPLDSRRRMSSWMGWAQDFFPPVKFLKSLSLSD